MTPGTFEGDRYDGVMRDIVGNIANGEFAKEWDAEREADHPTLAKLRSEALPPELVEWERELRATLGEAAVDRA